MNRGGLDNGGPAQQDHRYFPSKVDWWLSLLTWGSLLAPPVLFVVSPPEPEQRALGLVLLIAVWLPVAGLAAWMWRTTGYAVTRDHLIVRSGPFQQRIPLSEIRSVRRTRNPLASLALSLDRLEIRYGKRRLILISPEDRESFLALLRERCPEAAVD